MSGDDTPPGGRVALFRPMVNRSIVIVVGTRPEVIKMAPLVRALSARDGVTPYLIATGQHRELLADALAAFELSPHHHLDIMTPGQTPNDVLARVCATLPRVLSDIAPHALLAQGDTTTTLSAALCAYHLGIPVGHVEAGLRTYDHSNPFPEEANRQLVDRLSRWCFAPVESARDNLLAERIPAERIHLTGNTAVDALLWMVQRLPPPPPNPASVLITLHRRESFGEPLAEIVRGIRDFLHAVPEATIHWPVHPNPNVLRTVETVLNGSDRVRLTAPLGYAQFAAALAASRLVLTDSGGIQEEGPSLGKIVLVARDTTERPEGLIAGRNRLVGRTREGVLAGLMRAWGEPPYSGPLPADNPFGDGRAAERIADVLLNE